MTDSKTPSPPPPSPSKKDLGLMQMFARDAFAPVESGSHDLVSVTMNGLFEVTAVKISSDAVRSGAPEKLERAIQEAVNAAIREVARRNGERLAGAAPPASTP